MNFNNRIGKFLEFEIENVNKHLPLKRVSLRRALEGFSHYVSRDGQKFYINKKELELIQEICPEEKLNDVHLPMIIIRRRDLGPGTYTVGGELIEQFIIFKAIEKINIDWKDFLQQLERKQTIYLYKPDLIPLRKKLPTSTVIGFS